MIRLREIRQARGLTMKELGEAIGVTESAIGLYENGRRKPDYNKLTRIAQVLNCSIDELVIGENDRTDFAIALRQMRKDHGLSIQEFADSFSDWNGTSLSPVSVRRWENGETKLSESGMRKVAEYFGTTLEDMLASEEETKKPATKNSDGRTTDALAAAVAQADEQTRALIKRILGYSDSQVSAFLLLLQSLPNDQEAQGEPKQT